LKEHQCFAHDSHAGQVRFDYSGCAVKMDMREGSGKIFCCSKGTAKMETFGFSSNGGAFFRLPQ